MAEDDVFQDVSVDAHGSGGSANPHVIEVPVGMPLEQVKRLVIHETLKHTGGDKQRAASLLGIAARTIYRKLAK